MDFRITTFTLAASIASAGATAAQEVWQMRSTFPGSLTQLGTRGKPIGSKAVDHCVKIRRPLFKATSQELSKPKAKRGGPARGLMITSPTKGTETMTRTANTRTHTCNEDFINTANCIQGCILACATALLVSPALAGDARHEVTLLHGHPIYDEETQKAGVTMGLSIAGSGYSASPLAEACRELKRLSELRSETGDGLELVTLFVVPYKNMAVEGFYLPADGSLGNYALVKGKPLDASTIEGIVARAGIPPFVLHETNVEQEISCDLEEPIWTISWQDTRTSEDDEPDVIIEQARTRFMSIYRDVVQYALQDEKSVADTTLTLQALD